MTEEFKFQCMDNSFPPFEKVNGRWLGFFPEHMITSEEFSVYYISTDAKDWLHDLELSIVTVPHPKFKLQQSGKKLIAAGVLGCKDCAAHGVDIAWSGS